MRLIYLLLLIFLTLKVNGDFGHLRYSSLNVGDDFQGIAAKNFLPQNSIAIDREFLSQFHSEKMVYTIINGWFMSSKDCDWCSKKKPPEKSWPPSPCINPLLISMHMIPCFYSNILDEEGIKYFKQHGPVGTRDYETLRELEKRGIPCYFSGCLALTLTNDYKGKRSAVYAVDVSKKTLKYIKSKTKGPVIPVSHQLPLELQYKPKKRLEFAEKLLKKYRTAKCVVTERLHATIPCLAFETPVLFIANPQAGRFEGLGCLAHNCSEEDLLNDLVDFDFNNPPENPKDYLPIRKQLIEIVTDWAERNK